MTSAGKKAGADGVYSKERSGVEGVKAPRVKISTSRQRDSGDHAIFCSDRLETVSKKLQLQIEASCILPLAAFNAGFPLFLALGWGILRLFLES
ncbi:hypothetical protein MRX96_043656 [Rhipicephalus microplus]